MFVLSVQEITLIKSSRIKFIFVEESSIMSDKETPNKPPPPRYSHLHSEPISISFASPQQLAAFAAGAGNIFGNPRMATPMARFSSPMQTGNNMINPNHQKQAPQATSTPTPVASASATAASSSSSSKPVSKVLTPLPAQTIDLSTFKNFKFVTLDSLQIETRDVYDQISGTFKWEMCESQEDRCIDVIQTICAGQRVFLISSGGLGAKLVPKIHDLPQVYAIYIYCADVEYHSKWTKKFSKIRVVCNNDDQDLLPQFAVDVAQANIDWGDAFLKQGAPDRAREKFELAKKKLNEHAPNHDPAMDLDIQKKLGQCK